MNDPARRSGRTLRAVGTCERPRAWLGHASAGVVAAVVSAALAAGGALAQPAAPAAGSERLSVLPSDVQTQALIADMAYLENRYPEIVDWIRTSAPDAFARNSSSRLPHRSSGYSRPIKSLLSCPISEGSGRTISSRCSPSQAARSRS